MQRTLRPRPYSSECVELDFSHWGIWQSAPVKGSANACETFCGLPAHTDPQKVSPALEGHIRLLLKRGGLADTLPKGHLQKVSQRIAEELTLLEECHQLSALSSLFWLIAEC